MSTPVLGLIVAGGVVVAIYFLFVVPGERKYHQTKLRLMQERIERHEQQKRADRAGDGAAQDALPEDSPRGGG